MTTHTITLARHTAQVVGLMGVLVLGTWDSYGTEQLLLRPGPEWDGLAIDATFHNVPNDEGVTVLADTDGLVTVPPEACMRASKYATITFRGVQDGVQRISCNLPYMVLDHAQVPGANSTATPSENAQALTQMQGLRDGAVDAKNQAEAARDNAARSAELAQKAASSAANSAADAKNTLESIPDDYSTLSGKVDDNTSGINELKKDIGQLSEEIANLPTTSGQPKPVTNAADMTDAETIYLYLGSEDGYEYGYMYAHSNGGLVKIGLYGAGSADAALPDGDEVSY